MEDAVFIVILKLLDYVTGEHLEDRVRRLEAKMYAQME